MMGVNNFNRVLNFISLIALSWAAGTQWPSALKRCTMNDPNLEKCLMRHTQQALTRFSKGGKVFGLTVEPLRCANFDVNTNSAFITLNIHASNVTITGPSKVQLKRVGFDQQTSTYFIEGLHNHIKMTGNYNVKGVLIIPIESKGTFEYDLRGAFANHSLLLSKNARSKGHGKALFNLKTSKSMRLIVHDRLLGEQGSAALSNLVNDNMEAFSRAMWVQMEQVITNIVGDTLKPLTSKFNLKDFLPVASSARSELILDDSTEVSEKPVYSDPVEYSYEVRFK